jgi:PhnB protein
MAIAPYLNFGGNCREAFEHYHKILGGDLNVMTMADMPEGAEGDPVADDQKHLVMHASLTLPDSILMASDAFGGSFEGMRDIWVSYSQDDPGESKRVFDALAEGGDVTMPFGQTFWSPGFGMCVDKFGVNWMVNIAGSGQ